MPNWIEGTMKFRGTKEELLNMLRNGFESLKSVNNQKVSLIQSLMGTKSETESSNESDIEIIDGDSSIGIKSDEGIVVKGLRRAYVNQKQAEMEIYEEEEETDHIFIFENFSSAWGVDPKELLAFCQTHNVDAYFHGFECGMEFEQVIEIVDGEFKKNQERRYQDYRWECPFPNFGG